MKRVRKVVLWSIAAVLIVFLANAICPRYVSAGYATKAHIRFHYTKDIDADVTDPKDVSALKEILRGWASLENGEPACGFTRDTSITLANRYRSITFCPACDTCDGVRLGNSSLYFDIGERNRRRLERIVAKYGMTFPCE